MVLLHLLGQYLLPLLFFLIIPCGWCLRNYCFVLLHRPFYLLQDFTQYMWWIQRVPLLVAEVGSEPCCDRCWCCGFLQGHNRVFICSPLTQRICEKYAALPRRGTFYMAWIQTEMRSACAVCSGQQAVMRHTRRIGARNPYIRKQMSLPCSLNCHKYRRKHTHELKHVNGHLCRSEKL